MSTNLINVKVILLGDSEVGKTFLLDALRYQKSPKPHNLYIETIGVDLFLHRTRTIEYQIWDTSGAETYAHIVRTFLRRTHAVIFVYNDEETFNSVYRKFEAVEVLHTEDSAPYMCLVYTGNNEKNKKMGSTFAWERNMLFESLDLYNKKEVLTFWKKYSVAVEDKILQEDWLHGQSRLQLSAQRSSYWCYNWFTSWYGSR